MVDRICGCHVREEGLSRADVTRSLVSSDVLFSRLHRHSQSWFAARVDGDTDDAARHLTGATAEVYEGY